FGVEHLALAVALLATGATDGVGGLLAEQRLVAADRVDRRQGALQVLAELGWAELHGRRREPASGLPRRLLDGQLQRRVLRPGGAGALIGFGPGAGLGLLL